MGKSSRHTHTHTQTHTITRIQRNIADMSENYISTTFHNYWREKKEDKRTPQNRQRHVLHYSYPHPPHYYLLWWVSNWHGYFPFQKTERVLEGSGKFIMTTSWQQSKYLILRYLRYQTHSHLLNHLRNLTSSNHPTDSVCVCVCVCVHACVCVCAVSYTHLRAHETA